MIQWDFDKKDAKYFKPQEQWTLKELAEYEKRAFEETRHNVFDAAGLTTPEHFISWKKHSPHAYKYLN